MKKKALDFYTSRRGNCAQSAASTWSSDELQNSEFQDGLAAFGHGKAPDGICGALFAALLVVEDAEKEQIRDKFMNLSGGYAKCREIRKEGQISCAQCVEIAAGLLEECKIQKLAEKE